MLCDHANWKKSLRNETLDDTATTATENFHRLVSAREKSFSLFG
jgi:hypothetical protein